MKTVKIECKLNKRLGYKIINECDIEEGDVIFIEGKKEVEKEPEEVLEKPKKRLLKKKK